MKEVEVVAAYLEEHLGKGWTTYVRKYDNYQSVVLTLEMSQKAVQARRYPLDFLFSITPDKKIVEQALKNRTGHKHIGPYASRAILRRKVCL